MHNRLLLLVCALSFSVSAALSGGTAKSSDLLNVAKPIPTFTLQGNRGLSQTVSAEALGYGRLSFMGSGTWYQQEREYIGTPVNGTHVMTGLAAFSFGVNDHVNVFASGAGFGTLLGSKVGSAGIGTVNAGVLGSLPFPPEVPVRLGAQGYIIAGLSPNQVDTIRTDGYNYFDTRTDFDFAGRLIQSLVFGTESRCVKIHLNEGYIKSLQSGKDNLLLLAGGIQGNITDFFGMGLEINSRTSLSDLQASTDPLWLTPSLIFKTPAVVAFTLGTDISLSQERSTTQISRALEPFHVFGNIVLSFDMLEKKRRNEAEKERNAAYEKAELEKKNQNLKSAADSLAQKAREDSLANVRKADSLAQIAESLARKARQDSIALVETRKSLEEEKSKRSDAEKQLLSTGMLILDAVYFETGRSDISINSRPYLTIIGKMLAKYPKLMLEVGGHTDNVGRTETNMRLSQVRAESVRAFLISVSTDLSSRLTAMGYGSTVPKAENSTADGRKVNRRVELKVLNPDVLKDYNK